MDASVPEIDHLDLERFERGGLYRARVKLTEDGAGQAVCVPVIVARGPAPGPVVGITAALHGNELNGIPAIHTLFDSFDPAELRGTVVAVPIVNVPGYLANTRAFHDGADLNRLFPGKPDGSCSEVYAHAVFERIVCHFEVLMDLHTASFGRVNSLYIRADMSDPVVARFARLIGPQIIVHNPNADGTLRGAAAARGIHAVTVELGDPQRVQGRMTLTSGLGMRNVLEHLQMVEVDDWEGDQEPIECRRSYWLYTDAGGFLEVFPKVAERVARGEVIASLRDPWGREVRRYHAPEDGVVVGKSTNPVAHTGSRLIHLGVVAAPDERMNVDAGGAS